MLIDGEKWACEACVRGHRVSNCQHMDRPLQHIKKKGRPVTQCQHCRSQRKNRSAHVKCDCGEKAARCIHLGALEGHRESCCCNHGGRCTCAFRKDGVDSGASDVTEKASTAIRMPPSSAAASGPTIASSLGSATANARSPIRRHRDRSNTTPSDTTLMFDEHGRHKPSALHKHTKTQKSNPYPTSRVSMVRSTDVLSSYLAASKPANDFEDAEEDDHSSGIGGSDSGGDDDGSTPSLNTPGTATTGGSVPTPFHSAQQSHLRRSRSETASPLQLGATSFPQPHQLSESAQVPSLNMGAVNYPTFPNYYGADQPLYSAGLTAPSVDWNNIFSPHGAGLGGSTGYESDTLNDAGSFVLNRAFGYEFNGSEQAPTLATGTSGEVSEAEELVASGLDDFDCDYDAATDAASSGAPFSRVSSHYQLPTAPMNMRAVVAGEYGIRHLKASNKFLPTPTTTGMEDPAVLATFLGMPDRAQMDDEDTGIWPPTYHGVSSMTESPESCWETA